MTIEQTPRGWIAVEGGLAARGSTREEAQARLKQIVALVRRLAARSGDGAQGSPPRSA
jgi:hypothetical protein